MCEFNGYTSIFTEINYFLDITCISTGDDDPGNISITGITSINKKEETINVSRIPKNILVEIINKFDLKSLHYIGHIKADGGYSLEKTSAIKIEISKEEQDKEDIQFEYYTDGEFYDKINIFCE